MSTSLSHLEISTEARERAAERNEALPDGSYPIRNKEDLTRAVQSFGRAKDKDLVKKWIIKRAQELDAIDILPDSWKIEDSELAHHGVKGMKWGVRNQVADVLASTTNKSKGSEITKETTDTTKNSGSGGGGGGSSEAADEEDDEDAKKKESIEGIPEGDTREEFNARQKMIDEFLKKGSSDDKKSTGKSGKGGGGGKKSSGKSGAKKSGSGAKKSGSGGKKKGTSGGQKKSATGEFSLKTTTTSNTSTPSSTTSKTTYAAKRTIASVLPTSKVSSIPTNPRVQEIIAEINSSVEAHRNLVTTTESSTKVDKDELAHYGVLGMKWGVRNVGTPGSGLGGGGGNPDDEEEILIEEMLAKGLTIEDIQKELQKQFDNAGKTVDDIKKWIQQRFESPDDRYVREYNERAEKANEEYERKTEEENRIRKEKEERYKREGAIYYDPWGFPTSPDSDLGAPRYARKRVKHDELEGASMRNIVDIQKDGAEFINDVFNVSSNDDGLAHYGILGMKWGVRKDPRSSGRPQGGASRKKAPLSSVKKMVSRKTKTDIQTNSASNAKSSSTKQTTDSKTQDTQSTQSTQSTDTPRANGPMSDDELRNAINRLQMEKTYKQLLAEREPVKAAKAESTIKKIIKDSTRQAAGQLMVKTAVVVGTYFFAAAIAKNNPSLANAIMKGVGDNATSVKTAKADTPDATVNTQKTTSQNGSQSKTSDAGKQKVSAEVDANPRTSASFTPVPSAKSSLLDLGPTPQQNVSAKSVQDAYRNAASNYTPDSILSELSAYRKR